MFCSILWKPYLLKDIRQLEQLQRRATKYILNDYTSDYKTRLSKLNMLPLMYILDISDIIFAIKSLKSPTNAFSITDHITFASGNTRLGSSNKLQHWNFNVTSSNFFFNRLPRIWNALPTPTIKYKLTNFFGTILNIILIQIMHALFLLFVHVVAEINSPSLLIWTTCNTYLILVLIVYIIITIHTFTNYYCNILTYLLLATSTVS